MKTILPAFADHPEESAIIGRLIAGYGELEFDLAFCVRWIIDDEDTAFKVIFRAPGEVQRILMADAMARLKIPNDKEKTVFEQTIAAMHHCRKIRNLYAHCHWMEDGGGLLFFNLEEIAEQHAKVELSRIEQFYASLPLLKKQEEYFTFVNSRLIWLIYHAQFRAGLPSNPQAEPPPEIPRPPIRD